MIGSKRIWICLFWQISSYMFFEFDYQTKNCELQLLSVKSLFEFSCCLGQRAVVSVYGETRSIFIVAVNDVIACGDSIISSSSSSSSFSSSSFSSFSSSSFFQKNGGWGYRCQTGNPQPWIVPGEIFCLWLSRLETRVPIPLLCLDPPRLTVVTIEARTRWEKKWGNKTKETRRQRENRNNRNVSNNSIQDWLGLLFPAHRFPIFMSPIFINSRAKPSRGLTYICRIWTIILCRKLAIGNWFRRNH